VSSLLLFIIVVVIAKAWMLDTLPPAKPIVWGPTSVKTQNDYLCSVKFSSIQDGIYEVGKVHVHSIPSLRGFPNVALETVPMFV